ncbi:MAG: kelch repeat-containing protein [Sandaracinaceae bacterium]
MWMRDRITTAMLALLLGGGGIACNGASPGTDAGGAGADAGVDAGPPVDPSSAHFVISTQSGDGPWARWGFVVARIDDSTAILLGGTDANSSGVGQTFQDTWRVSVDADGTLTATPVAGAEAGSRYCACAAYDSARNVVVVFGGRTLDVSALPPNTWELDLGTETWTEITGATQPPGSLGCAMAYDEGTGRTYMFGGAAMTGAYGSTWRYEPTMGEWVEVVGAGPLARYDGVLFPSPADDGTLMLFGGSYGATGAAFYGDVWRFDPQDETWSEIVMANEPPGRRTAWLVRDPDRNGFYAGFGTDGRMEALGDFFYADLETMSWSSIEIPFDDGPANRGFSPALPGGPSSLGTLNAGSGATGGALQDAWRLVR